jgi:hypothetical protein
MSKRPLKEVEGMYLYTPQSIPTITCQLNKIRANRTRPVDATIEFETDNAEWPDAPIMGDRKCLIMQGPYCTLTGHLIESDQWWPNASGQRSTLLERDRTHCGRVLSFSSHVRLVHLPFVTRVNTINASSQPSWNAVTVRTDRTRPVKTETASGQG